MDLDLNVGRTRLTILSITLALFLFATSVYLNLGGDLGVRPMWAFLGSFIDIMLGFAVTLLSLLLFVVCQRLSSVGRCEPLTFAVGELLMYLALALALSGSLGRYVSALDLVLREIPASRGLDAAAASEFAGAAGTLSGTVTLVAGLTWGVLIYVAPAVFLVRCPLPRRRKRWLAGGYLVTVLLVFWISAYPYYLKDRAAGRPASLSSYFVRQLWQPALWHKDLAGIPLERFGSGGD